MNTRQLDTSSAGTIGTAKSGSSLKVLGRLKKPIPIQLGPNLPKLSIQPVVIQGLAMNLNISGPFLAANKIDQLHSKNCLLVKGQYVPLTIHAPSREIHSLVDYQLKTPTYVREEVIITPRSQAFLPLGTDTTIPNSERFIEGSASIMQSTNLHPVISALCKSSPAGIITTTAMNTLDQEIKVPAGTYYGSFSPAEPSTDSKDPWKQP